jgi:predicted PurR-regulated permease PerM
MTASPTPEPGWQLDSDGERWWDGSEWTEHRRRPEALVPPAVRVAAPAARNAQATAWVAKNVVLQSINGTIWGAMILALTAAGAVGATLTASALAACCFVPVIGWFIGIPIVLMMAFMGAMLWAIAIAAIFAAWACVALTFAAITLGRRFLETRS